MAANQDLIPIDPDLVEVEPPKNKGGNPLFKKGQPNPYQVRDAASRKARWADPATRTLELLEKYGVKKIVVYYKMICAGRNVPCSSGDALIIGRIARAYMNGEELERLYNRSYGKVPERSLNMNINLDATPEQLSERALELLARVNPTD